MEVESELNSHEDDLSECPFCGSRLKGCGDSLHGWDKDYKCGLELKGPKSDGFVSIENECPNKDDGDYRW